MLLKYLAIDPQTSSHSPLQPNQVLSQADAIILIQCLTKDMNTYKRSQDHEYELSNTLKTEILRLKDSECLLQREVDRLNAGGKTSATAKMERELMRVNAELKIAVDMNAVLSTEVKNSDEVLHQLQTQLATSNNAIAVLRSSLYESTEATKALERRITKAEEDLVAEALLLAESMAQLTLSNGRNDRLVELNSVHTTDIQALNNRIIELQQEAYAQNLLSQNTIYAKEADIAKFQTQMTESVKIVTILEATIDEKGELIRHTEAQLAESVAVNVSLHTDLRKHGEAMQVITDGAAKIQEKLDAESTLLLECRDRLAESKVTNAGLADTISVQVTEIDRLNQAAVAANQDASSKQQINKTKIDEDATEISQLRMMLQESAEDVSKLAAASNLDRETIYQIRTQLSESKISSTQLASKIEEYERTMQLLDTNAAKSKERLDKNEKLLTKQSMQLNEARESIKKSNDVEQQRISEIRYLEAAVTQTNHDAEAEKQHSKTALDAAHVKIDLLNTLLHQSEESHAFLSLTTESLESTILQIKHEMNDIIKKNSVISMSAIHELKQTAAGYQDDIARHVLLLEDQTALKDKLLISESAIHELKQTAAGYQDDIARHLLLLEDQTALKDKLEKSDTFIKLIKAKVATLTKTGAEDKRKLEMQAIEIAESIDRIATLETEMKRIEICLVYSDTLVGKLSTEIIDLELVISSTGSNVLELTSVIKAQASRIQSIEDENKLLIARRTYDTAHIQSLAQQSEAAIAVLRSELTAMQLLCEERSNEKSALEESVALRIDAISRLESDARTMKQTDTQRILTISGLQFEVDQHTDTISDYFKINAELKSDITTMRENHIVAKAVLEEKIESLMRSVAAHRIKDASLETEVDDLNKALLESCSERDMLTLKLEAYGSELQAIHTVFNEHKNQSTASIQNLQSVNENLGNEIAVIGSQLVDVNAALMLSRARGVASRAEFDAFKVSTFLYERQTHDRIKTNVLQRVLVMSLVIANVSTHYDFIEVSHQSQTNALKAADEKSASSIKTILSLQSNNLAESTSKGLRIVELEDQKTQMESIHLTECSSLQLQIEEKLIELSELSFVNQTLESSITSLRTEASILASQAETIQLTNAGHLCDIACINLAFESFKTSATQELEENTALIMSLNRTLVDVEDRFTRVVMKNEEDASLYLQARMSESAAASTILLNELNEAKLMIGKLVSDTHTLSTEREAEISAHINEKTALHAALEASNDAVEAAKEQCSQLSTQLDQIIISKELEIKVSYAIDHLTLQNKPLSIVIEGSNIPQAVSSVDSLSMIASSSKEFAFAKKYDKFKSEHRLLKDAHSILQRDYAAIVAQVKDSNYAGLLSPISPVRKRSLSTGSQVLLSSQGKGDDLALAIDTLQETSERQRLVFQQVATDTRALEGKLQTQVGELKSKMMKNGEKERLKSIDNLAQGLHSPNNSYIPDPRYERMEAENSNLRAVNAQLMNKLESELIERTARIASSNK